MERTSQIRRTLVYVLILNWLVALAKVIFGYWIKSNSMTADGFHSFSDGASNIIGLVGIEFAARPADKQHLYGHKKYETFAALAIAMLLFLVCLNIIHSSIERFYHPVVPKVNIYGFMVMFITIIINIIVMVYEYRKGRALNSDILVSDSMHTQADIFTSLSVIIALIAVKLGYPILDTIGSLFIALFIVYTAFKILRNSAYILCDTAVIDIREIEKVVKEIEGVIECHKIRTRGRKDDIYIDLHVLVRDDMHMDKAHALSYKIEEQIKKRFTGVTDIVVHLEPFSGFKKNKSNKDTTYGT
jgi:cation diffusion facilitator family transporter